MDAKEFCYWLKGYFEMSDSEKLDEKQVKILKDHLDLVFTKVTPDYSKIFKYPDGVRDYTAQPSNIEYPIYPSPTIC